MKKASLAAFPYAVFLLLLAVSWGRWIEPYVDSGRELMVPWRLAQGEALYRDVRFYHGPLAPYVGAALDILFGRCLGARVALAAAIALAHLEALRRLANRMLAPPRASLAVALAVASAFFLHPGGQLFPFSFDTAFAAAAILWALQLAAGRPGGERDWVAGACLTVALLSRLEMGVAAILLLAWETRISHRTIPLAAAPVAVSAPVYALLSLSTPFETLRREGWLAILDPPEAFRNVYAAYAGLDRPGLRLSELALALTLLTLVAAVLVAGAALSRASAQSPGVGLAIESAVLLLLVVTAAMALRPPASLAASVGLLPPLVRVVPLAVVSGAVARLLLRIGGAGRDDFFPGVPDAILFAAALFATRLLLAAGYAGPFNAFLLPLPLVVTAVLFFAATDRARAAAGEALPRLLYGTLVVFLLFRIATLALAYRHHAWSRLETPVGSLFLPEPVATTTRLALADLASRVPPGGAMVGFPEAGFFHYALGLRNPLPQDQFFPGHLDAALEAQVIRSLAAAPPDAVLLCNVIAVGQGSRAFGVDYLARLDRFVRERFVAVASFGPGAGLDARVGEGGFFVTVRVPRRPRANP